jgi:hypothetical protein
VDFATALPLVREALAQLRAALSYFRLDGFVSEHHTLQTDVSDVYRSAALWERDPKRAAAMQHRRTEALVPLLGACNPAIFIVIHKEAAMAAAQAAHEEADLRIHAVESRAEQSGARASRAELVHIQDTVHRSIFLYHHFLRCYSDPRAPWPTAETPDLAALPAENGSPRDPIDPTVLPHAPACTRGAQAAVRAVVIGAAAAADPSADFADVA